MQSTGIRDQPALAGHRQTRVRPVFHGSLKLLVGVAPRCVLQHPESALVSAIINPIRMQGALVASELNTNEISGILRASSDGDQSALNGLTPIVYEELRRLARTSRWMMSPS